MADRRQQKRTSRLSIAISVVFHGVIISALFYFAARNGMLGQQLKKIAVTMVAKEKLPEKPKEKPVEPKPEITPPKTEQLAISPPPPELSRSAAPSPPSSAVPAAAPPPATIPSFDFSGGKPVETTSDPKALYKGFVEYTLRSHWNRPEGVADNEYIAEIELTIDDQGRLLHSTWRKASGDAAWDNSIRKTLAETRSIGRPPPKGFPDRVVVRFDVQAATEIGGIE